MRSHQWSYIFFILVIKWAFSLGWKKKENTSRGLGVPIPSLHMKTKNMKKKFNGSNLSTFIL